MQQPVTLQAKGDRGESLVGCASWKITVSAWR
jgi:hypothetical protein